MIASPALTLGVALAFACLGTYWSKGQPWRQLLANRVTAYSEWSDPRDYSWALIALADFSRAMHALRRGGLNALGRSAIAPMDAPHLDTTLHVLRPPPAVRPGQAERVRSRELRPCFRWAAAERVLV